MCLSPHEMTTAQLEEILAYYDKGLTALEAKVAEIKALAHPSPARLHDLEVDVRWYARKVENYGALLKERAEAGEL